MTKTRFVPVPGHPGIAKRDGMYVVRSPHRPGRPSTFRTLKEALAEQGLRRAGATGALSEPLTGYALRWVETYEGRNSDGIDEETRDAYRFAIERYAKPYFKRKPLSKIDKPTMRAYIRHLGDPDDGPGLSASSVRKYVAPLRAMFAELVEDGAMPSNPATVRITGTTRARRPRALAPAVTEAILAEIPDALRDLVFLVALTGVRISEACGLQWRDLAHDDAGHPVLIIERQYRAKRGKRRAHYKPSAKTAAGNRTVRLAASLSRRLVKRRAELGSVAPNDPLFATSKGTPYDRHNVGRALRAACDRVGIERIGPHAFRHSIGSLLYEHGWTDVQVAAFLGHEDPSFTKRTYLHSVDEGDVSVLDGVYGDAEAGR